MTNINSFRSSSSTWWLCTKI